MRSRSYRWCSLLTLAICLGLLKSWGAETPRPNIVFFVADDLGWSDVGFHGSEIKTPNIDALANRGAKLEQFYVQPVCSPTRAALMTGRYPMRHGLQVGVVRPWADYGLPLEERTLPQALKTAGYFTAICGKWHLGHFQKAYLPTQRGFDHQYGHYNGAIDYFTHERDGGFDWHRNGETCRDKGYSTVLLGDEAVRLIEVRSNALPFFLYVPFNAPHAPMQALPEDLEAYKHIENKQRRSYAAMVHRLDVQVGRVVEAIAKEGLTTNTLFVFSSDNGGPIGSGATNGKLRAGKGTLYEGGVRVVAFATWEGRIKPGIRIEEPLHIVDWYPTLLKLAGAPASQPLAPDGQDIWPVLTQGRPSPHADILLNTSPNLSALRAGNWKLLVHGSGSDEDFENAPAKKAGKKAARKAATASIELYDLSKDPFETNNLASAQPDKVKELRSKIDAYAAQAVPPKVKPKAPDFKSPAVWGVFE